MAIDTQSVIFRHIHVAVMYEHSSILTQTTFAGVRRLAASLCDVCQSVRAIKPKLLKLQSVITKLATQG